MDKFQSFGEVLSMLRRRFFLWASIIVIGGLISLAYVLGLPRDYETYATLQLEPTSNKNGAHPPRAFNQPLTQD